MSHFAGGLSAYVNEALRLKRGRDLDRLRELVSRLQV
ncbi:hypothetical protein QF026_004744 [Streptomyces aurantiacus]|nr:hypothetical protein [Streptomyces aurantiacus]